MSWLLFSNFTKKYFWWGTTLSWWGMCPTLPHLGYATGCKKPYKAPDPPPMIKVRMQKTDPFDVTGVDYTGALYVREKGRECKVYVCLFTCAVTRAVHLEIVTDLTVKELLQSYRRFCSCKSLPRLMISNDASTYLAAANELNILLC